MIIFCACGCKKQLDNKDSRGRLRKYIHGHNGDRTGTKHTKEAIRKIKEARAKQIITKETKQLWSRQRTGSKNHFWRGGRYQMVRGYICIWSSNHPYRNKDKYVLEHRLVMEKKLGRYLLPTEVVHHKNGIRNDNRIENLKLFSSNSEHMRHEFKTRLKK